MCFCVCLYMCTAASLHFSAPYDHQHTFHGVCDGSHMFNIDVSACVCMCVCFPVYVYTYTHVHI